LSVLIGVSGTGLHLTAASDEGCPSSLAAVFGVGAVQASCAKLRIPGSAGRLPSYISAWISAGSFYSFSQPDVIISIPRHIV
ncbi:hypothetical protein, partial [Paenibacillus validus]|nr:hypothetical protein [Paenibacillus validus]